MNPQMIYREVGRKIRRYREAARQTQAQLAAQIGISRASLANIEAGRQQILLHHLYRLADALELDSPISLMAAQPSAAHENELFMVPLPDEGLTEKQRMEVLRLMGGVLGNRNSDDDKEAQ